MADQLKKCRRTMRNQLSLLLCVFLVPFSDAFVGTINRSSPRQKRLSPAVNPMLRTLRGGATIRPPPPTKSSLPMMSPATVFDNAPFVQSLTIFTAANGLGTLLSLLTKSQLHVDLLGTGAFALAALPSLIVKGGADVTRVKVSAAAMGIWGTKLAAFLLYRIIRTNHDARVGAVFETVSGTVGFWIFSLLWGVICSLPHTLGATSSSPGNPVALAAGVVLYAVGLAVETAADYQKWTFKASNPGKFCSVGLWSISQHPNFFGNMLIWAGILVMNAAALIDPQAAAVGGDAVGLWDTLWSYRRVALALLGPAFTWYLFTSQASGDLTNAVELAHKKYGDDQEYVKYVKSVPKIIPNFFPFGGEK